MLRTRSASILRTAVRNAPMRKLAIMPTVKVASDTSTMDFPAPSHVSLSSEAASIAQQLSDVYSNPDSSIPLSEEGKASIRAEVAKRIGSIPNSSLPTDWADSQFQVPSEIRLGDNPLFGTFKGARVPKDN